jgi:ComF family protein
VHLPSWQYAILSADAAWILTGDSIDRVRVVAEFGIDLMYPKRCAGCGRRGKWVCAHCEAALALFTEPWCQRCGIPPGYGRCRCETLPDALDLVRSVGAYTGWLRGAVIQLKYHGEWGRAQPLGRDLAHRIASVPAVDALVPVPLHPARLRQRGFNQSLLLARHAGRLLDVNVADVLIRTRQTSAQVSLGAEARAMNVAGAFALRPRHEVAGQSFVLVDDVITTGSTLAACAETLLVAGARAVAAATVAREM